MQGVCTVWQTQCVNWLYNKTKCTTYMCTTYMCTTLPMIVTWVYVWQCDTEWQSMAEYGLCTEGSDEVGHTPARPSSSSHCGHFAPFLPSTTLRCCAYKYSTSWIIHDQRVVYFRNFSLLLRTRGPRVSQAPQPTCSWKWVPRASETENLTSD